LYASKHDGRNRYTMCLQDDGPMGAASIAAAAAALDTNVREPSQR
jgi:hypothetical protein